MSYIFSRALVEAYSEANCSASELSAPLNSNPTPQAYCSPARMTDYSRLSRFGMTYAPLTDDRGAALLTWYREAFLARTFQPREKAPALTEPVPGSGGKCTELLARYDHSMSLWRTPQCSLLAGLDVFLETWPRSGMMRNGWCWERTTWAPRMSVSACGSLPKLPTLAKADGEGGGEVNWKPVRKSGHRAQLSLRTAVRIVAHVDLPGCKKQRNSQSGEEKQPSSKCSGWWTVEPGVVRMVHGVAGRVDRIKALGNGQVPGVAATAFQVLLGRFMKTTPN